MQLLTRDVPAPASQTGGVWRSIPAAHPRSAAAATASSSSAAPVAVHLQPKPGAMDAGFTLNKRIHARGGRGRKKDAEAKQKRADYVAWRDQQDAFRRNRPDDDHDDAAHGDAVSLMQIVAHKNDDAEQRSAAQRQACDSTTARPDG